MDGILIQTHRDHILALHFSKFSFNIILQLTPQVFWVVPFLWGFLPKVSILFLLDPCVYISFDVLSNYHLQKPVITCTNQSLRGMSHNIRIVQNEKFAFLVSCLIMCPQPTLNIQNQLSGLIHWIASEISAVIAVTIFTCISFYRACGCTLAL